MNCPECHKKIVDSQIHMGGDVAECNHCNFIFRPLAILKKEKDAQEFAQFDLEEPPEGTWVLSGGETLTLGAMNRSKGGWLLLGFALFWFAISFFALIGPQISGNEFIWYLTLIWLVFMFFGTLFLSMSAHLIAGKTELVFSSKGVDFYAGARFFNSKRHFDLNDIKAVEYNEKAIGQIKIIFKETVKQEPIEFGLWLNKTHNNYLSMALRKVIEAEKVGQNYYQPNLIQHLIE